MKNLFKLDLKMKKIIKVRKKEKKPVCYNYNKITQNVDITIWPSFLSSQSIQGSELFIWNYHVRIENIGNEKITLTNRYLKIIDQIGFVEEVRGEGVVGKKPVINSKEVFEYSSGVHLKNASGIISGYYEFATNNGDFFKAEIPTFSLDVPSEKNTIN